MCGTAAESACTMGTDDTGMNPLNCLLISASDLKFGIDL